MASRGAQPNMIRPSAVTSERDPPGRDTHSHTSKHSETVQLLADSQGINLAGSIEGSHEQLAEHNSAPVGHDGPVNHGCFIALGPGLDSGEIEATLQESTPQDSTHIRTEAVTTDSVHQQPTTLGSTNISLSTIPKTHPTQTPSTSKRDFPQRHSTPSIRTDSTRTASTPITTGVPRLQGLKGILQALGLTSAATDPNLLYREARYNRSSLDRFFSTLARKLAVLRANIISQMIPTSILMAISRRRRLRQRREELRRKMLDKKAKDKKNSSLIKTKPPADGPNIKSS